LSIHFKIYNRWGQIVFETAEIGKGWDGKVNEIMAANDVYFYAITYTGNNEDISFYKELNSKSKESIQKFIEKSELNIEKLN
jgi:gliding motility-associated-like protein